MVKMKNKYNSILNSIIKKYGMKDYQRNPFKPYIYTRIKCRQTLKRLLLNLLEDKKKISIITDDQCLKYIYKVSDNRFDVLNVSCFWGKKSEDLYAHLKEYYCSQKSFDVIVCVSSNRFSSYIDEAILNLDAPFSYINIYDYFEYNHISLCRTDVVLQRINGVQNVLYNLVQIVSYYGFFIKLLQEPLTNLSRVFPFLGSRDDIYCERHAVYLKYKKKKYISRNYGLMKIVSLYLSIKDFKGLFGLIDSVSEDSDGSIWLKELEKDLKELLKDIKTKNEKRTGKTVIINWLDGVSYNRVKDMPWVSSIKENGTSFDNMYNVMPSTSIAFKSMLSGKLPASGRLFSLDNIGLGGQYPVFDKIQKEGFEIKYVGGSEKGANHFKQYVYYNTGDCKYNSPCSDRQWDAISLLAANPQKDYFLFIHNFHETHSPHAFIDYNGLLEMCSPFFPEIQKKACRKYLDEQIEWYDRYYGNATKIFMSDHGDGNKGEYDYSEEMTHILFIIKTENNRRIVQMTSIKDMCNIILKILKNEDYSKYYSDRVYIEAYDAYSKNRVENILKNNISFDRWMQFQAIRTKTELYVLYSNGEERFYLLPDEEVNVIDNPLYKERVREFRAELVGRFINTYKEKFFKESKRIYEKNNVIIIQK